MTITILKSKKIKGHLQEQFKQSKDIKLDYDKSHINFLYW